jgi:GAF domain-containing protein
MMVRATAERVALALEGARLLEEAQKRATREAFLSDIATKLSASFQLDSILRDTVRELGQTFKNSTVTFQLVNPAEPTAASTEKHDGYRADQDDRGGRND